MNISEATKTVMTYENCDARIGRGCKIGQCHECDTFVTTDELNEASNYIVDYFEKYKWHDLREDPEDLPPEQCEVLTKIINSLNCYVHYETSWVIDRNIWVNHFGEPIAWRYIDAFDEEQI